MLDNINFRPDDIETYRIANFAQSEQFPFPAKPINSRLFKLKTITAYQTAHEWLIRIQI